MATTEKRLLSYDILRGYFLFVMVLLHIMINYYPTDFPYAIVGFTTGSFALLSGMIAGERAAVKSPRWGKSLFQAVKLILYFFIANIALSTFSGKSFAEVVTIFVKGAPQITTFEILLPIAYAQIVSLFLVHINNKKPLILICLAVIATDIFPQFVLYNALFLTIELLGFIVGSSIQLEKNVEKLTKSTWRYLVTIGITAVALPFIILAPSNWFFQLIFGFSTGGLLLCLFNDIKSTNVLSYLFIKLSQQSLFVYIVHIGISAYLDRLFPSFTANFIVCLTITILLSISFLFPIWVIQTLQQKGPKPISLLLKTVLQ